LKKVLFIALAAVLALSVGLIGCEGEGEEAPTEVLLGATLPQTGMFSGFGQQGWGMQQAVTDWNDTYGGMYLSEWDVTVPVRLIIKNNESQFDLVSPQSNELVLTDGVHALLSPDAPTDLHDATTVVATDNGVPSIICGGPFEPYTWMQGFAIGEPQPAPRDVPGYTMVDTWFMYMDEVDALNVSVTNGRVGVFASSDSDGTGWYGVFPGILTDAGYNVSDVNGLFDIDAPVYDTIVQGWIDDGVEILWGNCPGLHFGQLMEACYDKSFQPKICLAARAALFPVDVNSWGTSPPFGWGVGTEVWWSAHYAPEDGFVGIGNRTAASLAELWTGLTGAQLNRSIGHGYLGAQVMLDAISRAGDVDGDAINTALAATNMSTISGWVNFNSATHFSAYPLSFGQWFYDDEAPVGKQFTLYITASALEIIPKERDPFLYPEWPE
jgi:ABC-type branched-subunit amino acid transport system substrate-binding protein